MNTTTTKTPSSKAIWKGSISFSLVNIPVKLHAAIEADSDLEAHMFWAKDMSRIRFSRVAESTGQEVPPTEIVKGYETEAGVVVLSDQERDELLPQRSKAIEILEFVAEDEIDPIYWDRPYYVYPDKGGDRGYALLSKALATTGKVGLAQFVLRGKETLCALRLFRGALLLAGLRFERKLREIDESALPTVNDLRLPKAELALAKQLVESMAQDFVPDRYHDRYYEDLKEVVERKAKGLAPADRPVVTPKQVLPDIMAALEASVRANERARQKLTA